MKYFFFFLLISSINVSAYAQSDKDVEAVKTLLSVQQKAWNEGDIDAFMEGYWKSDELQFIGGNGPIYGWQKTKDRYNKSYPNQEAMGQLSFDIITVNKRSKKVISLVGKFTLDRSIGNLSGHFLLIFQKIKGEWLVVADFTASEG